VRGSGVLACSSSLLLYGHLGRCQAETPLIQLDGSKNLAKFEHF
jgi:hypothetical protein